MKRASLVAILVTLVAGCGVRHSCQVAAIEASATEAGIAAIRSDDEEAKNYLISLGKTIRREYRWLRPFGPTAHEERMGSEMSARFRDGTYAERYGWCLAIETGRSLRR